MSGDYITFNELNKALFGHACHNYQLRSWVKNRNFPMHTKKVGKNTFRIVYINEFWEWAKENRSFLDFNRMDICAIGCEPEWVKEQRQNDYISYRLQRKDLWTSSEEKYLTDLVKMQKYTYSEIAEKLQRSEGAVLRRLIDLGIKDRPLKRDAHGSDAVWKKEDYKILCDGIKSGKGYALIARAINKSEKAVRGKIYQTYYTECQDKVRKYIGEGVWGDGVPIPTVKQAINNSSTRSATKSLIEELASVLYHRTVELKKGDYDYFFQRKTCEHWDELNGVCNAGESDCDMCDKYKRISPQYCKRCGITFYEKKTNLFCASCRQARRKQAQRKWRILNK